MGAQGLVAYRPEETAAWTSTRSQSRRPFVGTAIQKIMAETTARMGSRAEGESPTNFLLYPGVRLTR
jgi:hypothetical protein